MQSLREIPALLERIARGPILVALPRSDMWARETILRSDFCLELGTT